MRRKTGEAAERKRRAPPVSSTDRCTQYALDVASGRVVAGPGIRGAAARHLRDLENGHLRGLWFDVEAVERVLAYFEEVLTVLKDGDVVPFRPADSQAFILGSVFGWKKADGWRRFQTAYVETAKGSGKSPLAGGIGMYCLTADKEARAEVYSAATKKDQARILFKDAVFMREGSPALMSRLVPSGVNPVYRLTHPRSGSTFEPISSDDGQSGPRPHCALVDEVHEHKNGDVISMLQKGFKFRRQPLLFLITNSGFDTNSICYEYNQRALKAVDPESGDLDDAFFSFVACLDENDDPFEDETCWPKANPTLGETITVEYLRAQVDEARRLPSTRNACLRLNFCRWTEAESVWMTREAWTAAEVSEDDDVRLEDFAGADCYLASDLSFARDLTAVAAVFPEGRDLYLFVDFWTPFEGIRDRKDAGGKFPEWAAIEEHEDKPRYISATPGSVIPLEAVAERLRWYDETFNVLGYAYDRYRHKDLEDKLAELGLAPLVGKMIEHPQGFRRAGLLYDKRGKPIMKEDGKTQAENPLWMPTSVEAFENAILQAQEDGAETRLRIAINPVLRYNAASTVTREDPAGTGGRIFTKIRAKGRIDGVVAGAMAIGLAKAPPLRRKSLDGMLAQPVKVG